SAGGSAQEPDSGRWNALVLSADGLAPVGLEDPALWFVFQGDRLLVREGQGTAEVLQALTAEQLGLQLKDPQFVGLLSGRACYCAEAGTGAPVPSGMGFHHLRKLWGAIPEEVFWAAGTAFQVMDSNRSHRFCGVCGAATRAKSGERAKECPRCGATFYPRISPAVIVAVVQDDRILLARARRFPVEMYSVIAGFVNPGETLEECVHREVGEETGVRVRNIRYFGSQPWPFPNSLMVGFTAEYAGGQLVVDPHELADAGWYAADAMPCIPDRPSIARRLINWFLEGRQQ
ncbi:MAG: NAD(+) diphosphatase, partial [Spirochaetales bacterium]|nr:NAD(+) diphosphatase [Spirochaetales bacterium]